MPTTSTARAEDYLTIPADYWAPGPRLRWSHGCDAVEAEDGTTLALAIQLTAVLEGVFAAPPVPPFAFILAALAALKHGARFPDSPKALDRLKAAHDAAGSGGNARNVGVLIAELCRGLPTEPAPPMWPDLQLAMRRREVFGERRRREWDATPPLPRVEFERRLAARLADSDDATLRHWLTHGGPPAGSGADLADAALSFPQRVAALLAELRSRDRLVGAATLAPALDAALTLPPRRPRPESVPQGGYSDVTTRGDPERLLPSQFALDPDEFVRRFAERELLYFRREEPHRPTAPERWLVVDQGVRTWGPVRLGLTAGVVALLSKNPAKVGECRLCVTSTPVVHDPAATDPKELADRLEVSDLTANPGRTLERVLDVSQDDEPPGPRDVLLFTHPRSLGEEVVRSAARHVRPIDRLFAVAVGDDGKAELAEWAAGGWVTHRRFRVDLVAGEAARVAGVKAPPKPGPAGEWSGDVEPIPFPFRAGTVSEVAGVIGFDADGEWVVAIGRGGLVHAKRLGDDSPVEVLPRAYRDGELLSRVEAVLGVNGGFVVCGLWRAGAALGDGHAAAHYDIATRTVTLHFFMQARVKHPPTWSAFPDLHCVAVVKPDPTDPTVPRGVAVDLTTRARYPYPEHGPRGSDATRATAAWQRACTSLPTPVRLPVVSGPSDATPPAGPYLEVVDGVLLLRRWPWQWATLRPTAQGEPLAAGAKLFRAELAGSVLAVMMRRPKSVAKLYLLRGPDGAILREFWPSNPGNAFALSRDGTRIARQVSGWEVEVGRTDPGGQTLGMLSPSGFHTRLALDLSAARLTVRVGRYMHTFTLNEFAFRHERSATSYESPSHRPYGYGTSGVAYDRDRFAELIQAGPWLAGYDRWGQVVLLDRAGKLVLTLAVRRELAAAWLHDGTRWGAAALLGAAPDPNAAVRIGRALQDAAGRD